MVTDEDGKCDGMGSHLLIQSGGETIATQRWYLREYHTIIQPMNKSSIGEGFCSVQQQNAQRRPTQKRNAGRVVPTSFFLCLLLNPGLNSTIPQHAKNEKPTTPRKRENKTEVAAVSTWTHSYATAVRYS